MVGLPCHGGMLTAATLRGLLETQAALAALNLPFACATLANESLVTRARNTLAARFLASSASHLLFVDADIGFGADSVLRLLGHGRPLIGGLYRSKRVDRTEWVAAWATAEDGTVRRDTGTGAIEVAMLGAGFLLIHRDVLTRLAEALPETRYVTEEGEPAHALFDAGIERRPDGTPGRYVSEDYFFCHRWRAAGGEVWCDPGLLLQHQGQVALAADPMTILSAP
ncbi:hypothetical protein [Muricoccus radiodurans]|uniref:hypothetical protein n=1 Tax=Muricoccus radiodurans TaxID=2231721 RepID=UPI003CF846ED